MTLPLYISMSDSWDVIVLPPQWQNFQYSTQMIFQAKRATTINTVIQPVEFITSELLSVEIRVASFSHSPYLNGRIREVVSDCALPISVVTFSFIGSYLFLDIQREYRSLK